MITDLYILYYMRNGTNKKYLNLSIVQDSEVSNQTNKTSTILKSV